MAVLVVLNQELMGKGKRTLRTTGQPAAMAPTMGQIIHNQG